MTKQFAFEKGAACDLASCRFPVTFEERGGQTLLMIHDLYPSKEALDGAIASGSTDGMPETLDQLDELVGILGASAGRREP